MKRKKIGCIFEPKAQWVLGREGGGNMSFTLYFGIYVGIASAIVRKYNMISNTPSLLNWC